MVISYFPCENTSQTASFQLAQIAEKVYFSQHFADAYAACVEQNTLRSAYFTVLALSILSRDMSLSRPVLWKYILLVSNVLTLAWALESSM